MTRIHARHKRTRKSRAMTIDQSEIDKLLAGALAEGEPPARPAGGGAPASSGATATLTPRSAELSRILKLRVPVRVRIASQRLPIDALRKLSIGTILQFEKSIESPLELLINNHVLGLGEAVKVSEHFGLRIGEIASARDRVLSFRG